MGKTFLPLSENPETQGNAFPLRSRNPETMGKTFLSLSENSEAMGKTFLSLSENPETMGKTFLRHSENSEAMGKTSPPLIIKTANPWGKSSFPPLPETRKPPRIFCFPPATRDGLRKGKCLSPNALLWVVTKSLASEGASSPLCCSGIFEMKPETKSAPPAMPPRKTNNQPRDTDSVPTNLGLTAAKTAKQDEFYTQYADIQKEVEAYLEYDSDTFRGKVVYCNCDDPFESNFFKYFAANFNKLGLRKLISTSYDGSPIAGGQMTLAEYVSGKDKRRRPKAVAILIEEVKDLNGDGATGIEDVELFLKQNPHTRKSLKGGGDFRSLECVELLKETDIVVTNPPFSLFREYVALLVQHGKRFLIIGNQNAITYKEVFPLIKDDKLWLGVDNGGTKWFQVKDDYDIKTETRKRVVDGIKYFSMGSIMWFTNLDHGRRHQMLPLMTMAENLKYSRNLRGKQAYDRYDNYDAIEVSTYKEIPSDYEGVMGVPITFLDKYNPEQFEIVGTTESNNPRNAYRTRFYTSQECRDAYQERFGKEGVYDLNASGVVNGVKLFKRILIRHRKPMTRKSK